MELRLKTFLLLCFCFVLEAVGQAVGSKNNIKVHYLDAGNLIDYQPVARHRGFFESDLRSYCYRGNRKTLGRFFETIELQLEIESDDYTQYEGSTPEEVREHHDEQRSLFSFNLFSQKKTRLQLSPFQQQCIGIETVQPYRVRLQQVRIDFWRVIQLAVGLALFLSADKLSHNAVFYYITGVALGICSSFMLLIWLAGKLVPRRTMMYGVLIGGWTIGFYVIQMLWQNLQLIVLTYRTYVFWYILLTGLLSFFFCYRLGPPKNKRSKKIIKWLLQLMALGLIYFSSRFEEASAAAIIITMIFHYFPRSMWYKLRAFYLRRFPPKRRLLSNEEYYEQGVLETTKSLAELRAYASSPECKQWKVMSKLRDPLRFAAFVEGASHLRDEEILRFESSTIDDDDEDNSEISTDDDEVEIIEKRVNPQQQQQQISRRQSTSRQQYYEQQPPARQYSAVAPHAEISEDEGNNINDNDYDDEENAEVVEVATSSYKMRHTPNLKNSSRLSNGGNISINSPPIPFHRASILRTPNRSARLVASAQRNSSVRTFAYEDNDESED